MNTATKQPPPDRRARTRKEIKQLIAERNNVLSQYYNLASHADQNPENSDETLELLQEFCQDLVDYLATGHFEIYRRIEEKEERRSEIKQLASQVFDRISETTAVAVAFNDLYDTSEGFNPEVLNQLPEQLSKLGEELAIRIDLEDRFINSLLSTAPGSGPVQATASTA
ncbi:MAG: Rsd/AlgQ family anti-sigma factor [Thiotrichales bacterium]|nr:MAG: Rsd/AlgQ family anti-sigma factor [Thiotrichales bacterium]